MPRPKVDFDTPPDNEPVKNKRSTAVERLKSGEVVTAKKRFTRDDIVAALGAASGNYQKAAENLGTTREFIRKYCEEDYPDIQEVLTSIREGVLDRVEDRLLTNALAGNTTALVFYLKAQGKHRGWNDKAIDVTKPSPAIDVSTMDRVDRSTLREALQKARPYQEVKH